MEREQVKPASPAPPPITYQQSTITLIVKSLPTTTIFVKVESSLQLPDTHNTVAVRASLAQEYVKVQGDQLYMAVCFW